MSAAHALPPQRAPRDLLDALIVQATSRRERSLDWLLVAHRRADELPAADTADTADTAAPASPEPEDEGLALLRRLREAGL